MTELYNVVTRYVAIVWEMYIANLSQTIAYRASSIKTSKLDGVTFQG